MTDTATTSAGPDAGYYVSIQEAARFLGVTETHIHRLREQGDLAATRAGKSRRWWILRESLLDLIRRNLAEHEARVDALRAAEEEVSR